MRAQDLELSELLEFDPAAGAIRFAGQRAVLMDAVAAGLLRKYLAESFGENAARAVLTQYGVAHGRRMADAMHAEFQWENTLEWRRAGPRIHALQGLFQVLPGHGDALSPEGMTLVNSYEAEQHILHFGRSDSAVCWTIAGFTSGFLSRCEGSDLYVIEDRCVGRGDAACHMVAHSAEDWRSRNADELRFFEPSGLREGLDVSIAHVTDLLKAAERKVRRHRRVAVGTESVQVHPLGIIARSVGMQSVVGLAHRVAAVDSTVLISGESGAGKERIARLIHEVSPRASGPFVAVNCGAITESLLESELFGHVRGAFTGAARDRLGLFEAANRGTLLLDEIGDVSLAMQVKLLRVLQEREVRRVGENKSRPFDVRVLAATNRDLDEDIEAGRFRQDLYYRLKVIELHVPSLRERLDDILPLARLLLEEAAASVKRRMTGFSPAAADQLLRYCWPGNVRELENAMMRAVALAAGRRVEVEDLPEEIRVALPRSIAPSGNVRPLCEIEREYILAALERNDGNQTATSKQLQIGTATLYRKLKKYGMIEDRRTATTDESQ